MGGNAEESPNHGQRGHTLITLLSETLCYGRKGDDMTPPVEGKYVSS